MIRVEDLVHGYDDGRALDRVTVGFDESEFVLLLGGNGSGKTTFLRHLNGLLLPDKGRVYVDGVPTDEDARQARRRVGMTFQDAASQVVAETVEDDIAFGPENLGLDREEIRRRVEEAAEAVGATELLDRSPYELSGANSVVSRSPACWRCVPSSRSRRTARGTRLRRRAEHRRTRR